MKCIPGILASSISLLVKCFQHKTGMFCKFLNQNQNQRCWRKLIFKLFSVSFIHSCSNTLAVTEIPKLPHWGHYISLKQPHPFGGKCQRPWLNTAASSVEGHSWLPATADQQPPPSGTTADFCLLWTKSSPLKSGLREAKANKYSEEYLV